MEQDLEKRKKKKTSDGSTFPYKPTVVREIKRSLRVDERQRSKSMENRPAKYYFERIVFNSELEIESVWKIFTTHHMECIDSLEMTECKDILILRGKEFYLIGCMNIFKEIDLV